MPAEPMPRCEFQSNDLVLRIDVTLAADPNAIGLVVERVMEIARGMQCAEGKEFEVELAIQEALANAVKHGCKGDPSKMVQFCVACDQNRGMLMIVRDPGEGFDPRSIPDCIVGENVYSEHGRGIFLINRLMDQVSFERGGTEIRMKKA